MWIAIIALVTSIVALVWNIVRDLIIDRVKIKIEINVGRIFSVAGTQGRAVFVGISEPLAQTNRRPLVIQFSITNIGRRPVVIEKISGKYKKNQTEKYWVLTTRDLPKVVEPYGTLFEHSDELTILKDLLDEKYDYLFAMDTKSKQWKVSKQNINKLKEDIKDFFPLGWRS